jgi:hypothetical protein
MSAEPSTTEPRLVVGPLAFLSLAALWRGLRRRSLLATGIALALAATEVWAPGYRRLKRRWTVFSITEDQPGTSPAGPDHDSNQ